MDKQASAVSGLPFSEAVKAGQLVFLSGQIGIGGGESAIPGDRSFEQEVRQVMTNLGEVLQRQGLHFGNLVQVSVYLTDMADYAVMNRVYAGYFQGGFPTRVCIGVKELALQARIEISGVAQVA